MGLDDEVGGLGQSLEDFSAIRGLQVQGNATLVEIGEEPEEGLLGVRDVLVEGTDVAGGVAAGALDLDHIGAEVTQDLAAHEPFLIGKVKHPVAAEETFTVLLSAHA